MHKVSAILAFCGLVAASPALARVGTQTAEDLGSSVKPGLIKAQDSLAEPTHSVVVTVPELLPGGRAAELSYVFGDKSKILSSILPNCPAWQANIRNSSENQRPPIRTSPVLATSG
jgi:hypothetical protein